jgi:hypothetical protein
MIRTMRNFGGLLLGARCRLRSDNVAATQNNWEAAVPSVTFADLSLVLLADAFGATM